MTGARKQMRTVRPADVFLAAALVGAVSGAVRWALSKPEPKPRKPTGAIVVEPMAPPYSESAAEPSSDGPPGRVVFDLVPGESFVGVSSARVFPIDGKRVKVEGFDDVVTAHVKGGLDLTTWLERRNPSGPYAMLFGLWIDTAEGRQLRAGWSRFEASDLRYARLVVRPRDARACRISVVTRRGQPIPGALVSLAPAVHVNGLADVLLETGADGTCTVRGLDSMAWVASLPQGVGPDRKATRLTISPDDAEARIVAQIAGDWDFVEHEVRIPLLGGSLLVTDVAHAAGGTPRAWPVSPLVVPGGGPQRRWTWMTPQSAATDGLPVAVTFKGFTPLRIEDVRTPFVVEAGKASLRVSRR